MIYMIKQEGLCQNKVNSNLVFTCNCKWAICMKKCFHIIYPFYPR